MENVTNKLQEMFKEIRSAVNSIQEAVKRNPREIIALSKVIEKGEKRVSKEYEKRKSELSFLSQELKEIEAFAETMGYKLQEETENEESEQAPTESSEPIQEPASETTKGIKVKIGEGSNVPTE